MPDHEDILGVQTPEGDTATDTAEQLLGDGANMGGDTAAHTLGNQIGQLRVATIQFLKVKRNVYVSIAGLGFLVCLLVWSFVGEDYSPIPVGSEAVRAFETDELCYFLKDNIESNNESIRGKVIEVSGVITRWDIMNLNEITLTPESSVRDHNINVFIEVAPSHCDQVLVQRFDEFVWKEEAGMEYGEDGLTMEGWYYYDEDDIPIGTPLLETNSPRFLIRVRGICRPWPKGKSAVFIERARIEHVELLEPLSKR